MEMRATGNGAILLKDRRDEVTVTGIILTKDANPFRDAEKGTVVTMGKGRTDKSGKFIPIDPMIIVGCRVAYVNRTVNKNMKTYNPNEFIEGENTYVHVDANDILAVYVE